MKIVTSFSQTKALFGLDFRIDGEINGISVMGCSGLNAWIIKEHLQNKGSICECIIALADKESQMEQTFIAKMGVLEEVSFAS